MPLEQQMPAFLSVPALMANFSILPDSDRKPKSAKFSSETFCLPMMQLWLVKVTTISITSSMAFWMPVMTSAWPQPPASKKPKSRLRVLAFPHLSSSRTMHLKWSTALSTLVVLSLAPPFWTPEKERGLDSLQPTCLSFRNILEKPEAPKSHQNGWLQSLHHQCTESPGRTALRTVLSQREEASPPYTPSFARGVYGGLAMYIKWTSASYSQAALVQGTSTRTKAGRTTQAPFQGCGEEGYARHWSSDQFLGDSCQWKTNCTNALWEGEKLLHITVGARREHQKARALATPTDSTYVCGSCRCICRSRIGLQSHLRKCLRNCAITNTC